MRDKRERRILRGLWLAGVGDAQPSCRILGAIRSPGAGDAS